MKRVLVAGGAGLIGSHLCELLLERDCEVLVIDNFLSSSRDNLLSLVKHPRFTFVEQDAGMFKIIIDADVSLEEKEKIVFG